MAPHHQSGTHEELLALGGYYAKLYSYQSATPTIIPHGKSFARVVKVNTEAGS